MKFFRVITGIVLLLTCSSAIFGYSEAVTTVTADKITQYRAHSISHATAKNMHMFLVNGLSSGCNSVFLYADQDPYLFATTLSAIQKQQTVTLIYDVDAKGPWGDPSYCQLTSITINR